jgi:hypothetical protein
VIYQSKFFESLIPEVSKEFSNLHWTDQVASKDGGREASLKVMRQKMISSYDFCAAVFIGGMEGIFEEYEYFAKLHPHAIVIPIASSGGAAKDLFDRLVGNFDSDKQILLRDENRYQRVFNSLIPAD